jgi:four helix bundle protein
VQGEPEQNPTFENGQDIRDRTFRFACEIVRFCEQLERQGGTARLLAPQLLRSGTAPSAMLEEARAAESRADFISKVTIGLKEAREAHVRLRTCVECAFASSDEGARLVKEANEIVAILMSIARNAKRNAASRTPRDRTTNS